MCVCLANAVIVLYSAVAPARSLLVAPVFKASTTVAAAAVAAAVVHRRKCRMSVCLLKRHIYLRINTEWTTVVETA